MRSVSRRTTLAALAGFVPAAQLLRAAGKDFWNTKKPEEWSTKEVEVLLSDSPWAREASMEFNAEGMGGGMGGPGGGMGGPGGGMGGPGGGMGGPGGGMGGPPGMGDMKATVRWESAAPVAAAQKIEPPANAQTHYVISVSGLPAMRGRGPGGQGGPGGGPDGENAQASDDRREQMRERMQARLKEKTKLTRKDKDPINVDTVERKEEDGETVYVFSFLREGQAITAGDKEVTFVSALGPMEVKAKFSLKQMIYQGQLAL